MSQSPLPQPEEPAHPLHVAVIMDGNGRWATARGLPRKAGHRKGAEAVRACVRGAVRQGVTHLTLFGFSSENWRRPSDEVSALFGLLRLYLRNELAELEREGVRLRFIGDRRRFSADICQLLEDAEARTASNRRLHLTVALNYGGRAEIAFAARRLAQEVAAGRLSVDSVDEEALAAALYGPDLPDPDVLIRTSGEKRISNFLLWQCAYSEMVFLDVTWPDFTEEHLAGALTEYRGRVRRFGAVAG